MSWFQQRYVHPTCLFQLPDLPILCPRAEGSPIEIQHPGSYISGIPFNSFLISWWLWNVDIWTSRSAEGWGSLPIPNDWPWWKGAFPRLDGLIFRGHGLAPQELKNSPAAPALRSHQYTKVWLDDFEMSTWFHLWTQGTYPVDPSSTLVEG